MTALVALTWLSVGFFLGLMFGHVSGRRELGRVVNDIVHDALDVKLSSSQRLDAVREIQEVVRRFE